MEDSSEKHRVAYIDEHLEDVRVFERYANDELYVIPIKPLEDIEDLLEEIFKADVRAIITDFDLSEYDAVIKYNGVEVIEKVLAIKDNFPCFVLTSYEDKAAHNSDDVNIVYEKKIMAPDHEVKITFKEKIRLQIEHYLAQIEKAKEELSILIKKKKDASLNASEEEKLIKLDGFLERAFGRESALPKHLKDPTHLDKLDVLIKDTEELISKFKAK